MPRQGRKKTRPASTPQVKSQPSQVTANGTTSVNYKDLKRSERQKCCKEPGLPATRKPHPPSHLKSSHASSQVTAGGTTSVNYKDLKRSDLQKCCKELGLPATGKNVELVERLVAYRVKPPLGTPGDVGDTAEKTKECSQPAKTPWTVPQSKPLQEVKSEPIEEKTEVVKGWCVVHGMVLYRPSSSWAPLLLQKGLVYVQDGKNITPFHLRPLNIPVPDGLLDNHICEECVLRNRETTRKTCHRIRSPQDFLNYSSTTQPFPPPSCASKDRRRVTQSKKFYQPQEDQAYAQWVDGILTQMAHGELGMDQILRPLQPLVVHSPGTFKQSEA